jgi:lysophospholipase L1-like esterase
MASRAHGVRMRVTMVLMLLVGGCAGRTDVGGDETATSISAATPYLALGDSIAFGFDPRAAPTDPTAFVGYPEELAADEAIGVTNAACQGETSGSFLDVTVPDNGCHKWRADGDVMHVAYASNAQSQLDFAVGWLRAHPGTRLVTLGIGANDLLLAQAACNGDTTCTLGKLPGVTAGVAANVAKIALGLRAAGYFGELIAVSYYSIDYSDVAQQLALAAINQAQEDPVRAVGGRVASGYDAFALASVATGGSPCKAGLLIPLTFNSDGSVATCDKHPSPKGRVLLARAVELAQ